MYFRLRSLRTGHQWDSGPIAAAAYLASGGVQIVRTRPTRGRMKPLRDLAGNPTRPRPRVPEEGNQ